MNKTVWATRAFKDHTAIVTGGAAGIGRALCEQLAEFGARVVAADINGPGAEEVAALIRQGGAQAEAVKADVSNAMQIEALVSDVASTHGRLDFMFNNATVAGVGELRDGNIEDFRRSKSATRRARPLTCKPRRRSTLRRDG